MKEIKLTIDGKEVQLTAEQIKALGIDMDDGCVCDRVDNGDSYYYVGLSSKAEQINDARGAFSDMLFKSGNYYRSKSYAQQIALHQQLNNLLRRYSEQHGGDNEWNTREKHWGVYFELYDESCHAFFSQTSKSVSDVFFAEEEVAKAAIDEVVEPFMKEHPDFVW